MDIKEDLGCHKILFLFHPPKPNVSSTFGSHTEVSGIANVFTSRLTQYSLQYLLPGDLIIDASNENWHNTQRRQGMLVAMGVFYVGAGVSGGYQAARRGPSICPGGEQRALDIAMPLLEKIAAKDPSGKPCTARCGMGGSGHYVKMVHNGIEHGMMSAQAEAWQIMSLGLGMTYDEIGDEFARWTSEGELVSSPP